MSTTVLANQGPSTTKSIMVASLSSIETINIGAGDHVKFDMVAFSQGSDISLNNFTPYNPATGGWIPSVGRFTLTAGKTYRLESGFVVGNTSGAHMGVAWFDVVGNNIINPPGLVAASDGVGHNTIQPVAYISPVVNMLIDLRILFNTGASTIEANAGFRTRAIIETI